MKKIVARMIGIGVFVSASGVATADSLFTGDKRLACEAILCLSSSQQTSKCSPSLDRYFGIKRVRWVNTKIARHNFLNLCPTARDQSAGMPALVEAIVNGAGRCDAATLNGTQLVQRTRKVCKGWNSSLSTFCNTETYYVISDTRPSYCTQYWDHNYTNVAAKYVGTPEQNGRWVNGHDFVVEQARWEQAHPSQPEEYPWLNRLNP